MKEKFLPIGTVLILKGGMKKVMITGFLYSPADKLNEVYDYCGCVYPEGVLSLDQTILFNHDQISEVFYMGYESEKQKQFHEVLKKYAEKK